jgi:hypothetical protein
MLLGNGFILHVALVASSNSSQLRASRLRHDIRKTKTVCPGLGVRGNVLPRVHWHRQVALLLHNVLLADDNMDLAPIESINARKRSPLAVRDLEDLA